ncbi:MAG TPA: MlaE family lipid ABC transporter permease subunit [Polyangiaceae bacterium]
MTGTPWLDAPDVFGDRISRAAGYAAEFRWFEREAPEGTRVELGGALSIEDAPALWKRVSSILERSVGRGLVEFDFSAVDGIDGACIALLVHLRSELAARRVRCEFSGGSPSVRRMLDLYGGRRRPRARRIRRPKSAVAQVGQATIDVFAEVVAMLDFLGQLVEAAWAGLRNPRRLNYRDAALTMERAGADAAPIVMLINFLVGFVMAYQSALQLRQFGADIYVADLVGVAMTRELAPLMTAIIVCGRTGAAFAAELGTMKVSEEIDALRTLGLRPLQYLVMPRVLGVVLVAPLLTLLADAVGIAGGLLVGHFWLDVTPQAYWIETLHAVKSWDVWSGALKSVAFATAIALIACQQGLATTGGAEGVGRRTTSAVVSILFALILLDAIFTLIFGALGL